MKEAQPNIDGIPKQVFTNFISELRKSTMDSTIVDCLEKTIIVEGNISEQGLRTALTPKPVENDPAQED